MTDNNEKWEPLGGYTNPIIKGADPQSGEWGGKVVPIKDWDYKGLMEGSSFKVQGLPNIVIPTPPPEVLLAHMVDGTSVLVDYLRGCLRGMPEGSYVIEMEVPALREHLGVSEDLLYVYVTKGEW